MNKPQIKNLRRIITTIVLLGAISTIAANYTTIHTSIASYRLEKADKMTPYYDPNSNVEFVDVFSCNNKFRIVYFVQEKRWALGSDIYLDDSTLAQEYLLKKLSETPMKRYKGYIAVGVASQEGDPVTEGLRADKRADKIIEVLKESKYYKDKDILKLNLGKHTREYSKDSFWTSYQRRLMIIAIEHIDQDLNINDIKNCLKIAMENVNGLNFEIDKYSQFTLSHIYKN